MPFVCTEVPNQPGIYFIDRKYVVMFKWDRKFVTDDRRWGSLDEAVAARDALVLAHRPVVQYEEDGDGRYRPVRHRWLRSFEWISGKVCFTHAKAELWPMPTPRHVFKFSEFFDAALGAIRDEAFVYEWRKTPLATKGGTVRGEIGERVAKRVLVDVKGKTILPRAHESHDLRRVVGDVERRGEVKLARMHWNVGHNQWEYRASKVKWEHDVFDELYLVFEGLSALYVYKWGGQGYSGTADAEDAAKGGQVVVHGEVGVRDPEAAERTLLRTFEEKGNTLLGIVRYDDPEYADEWTHTTKTEREFASVPFGTLQGKVRGAALEAVVAALLTKLGHRVALPTPGEQTNGAPRSQGAAECDLLVDGVFTEVKSCLQAWVETNDVDYYWLLFGGVKARHHDVRYLAWMSTTAVHVWKQPEGNRFGLSGTGDSQEIKIAAESHVDNAADAEAHLLKKLDFHGLEYVARLEFTWFANLRYKAAVDARREASELGTPKDAGA